MLRNSREGVVLHTQELSGGCGLVTQSCWLRNSQGVVLLTQELSGCGLADSGTLRVWYNGLAGSGTIIRLPERANIFCPEV